LLLHLFRQSVATHTPKQLVIKRFVANKDSACGLHPGNGRPNVWRGGKQQVLHYVDFVVEAKKPEAGLEHTDIRLAARHEDLRPFQVLEVIPDLSFLRQVEEILLEKLGPIAQVLHHFPGAGSLLIHRPFERHHDRNSEIGAGEPISSRGSQGLSRGSVGWPDLPLVAAWMGGRRNCKNVTVAECCHGTIAGIAPRGQAINNHDPARLVIALHKKAPVTVSRPGAFH
jgi:hypothetical protein